ncbi:MAG: hypothetical protein QNL62_20400 [Gammaproteobacteria bacterium]|nr:hypothetical protein [Gammaproteobacteria bacterium]
MQRGSKNNLCHHFKKLKKYEGWVINEIDRDDGASLVGNEINRRGKLLVEQECRENILTAQLITKQEYIDLKNSIKQKKLTDEEESAMRQYEIESFYYQDISDELIADDKDGKKRWQIRMYENYTRPDSELLMVDRLEDQKHFHKTDKKTLLAKKKFLHQLFTTAGLADKDNDFITNKPIQGDSLSNFANFCTKKKETIARWFEIDIRHDIQRKPAQQLSQFLKLHGITWKKLKPINKNGSKIYPYEIEQSVIDEINTIVDRRIDSSITQTWHENRNSTIDNRLFKPEIEEENDDDFTSDDVITGINL